MVEYSYFLVSFFWGQFCYIIISHVCMIVKLSKVIISFILLILIILLLSLQYGISVLFIIIILKNII